MEHQMKLKEIYFNKIKSGEKIYEIRLNDEKRRLIRVGDTLIFKKEPDLKETAISKVTDLIYFNSFEKMISSLPIKLVGFENVSKQEIVKIYHQFYSAQEELRFGVVAIKVQIIR